MKFDYRSLIAIAGLAAGPALSCEYPSMVSVPDGASASLEMLLGAQEDIRTYMAAMEEYLACINEEIDAGGEDAPETFQALMVQRHNGAVSEMETVAAAFNEQVRAYREANPEEE